MRGRIQFVWPGSHMRSPYAYAAGVRAVDAANRKRCARRSLEALDLIAGLAICRDRSAKRLSRLDLQPGMDISRKPCDWPSLTGLV